MKKNNFRGKLIFPVFFFFFTFSPVNAITANIDIRTLPEITIFHEIQNINISSLFETLGQGYQSHVFLQIKLYKKKNLPVSIFGDELIKKIDIHKYAKLDIFSKNYELRNENNIDYFENEMAFLKNFLNHELEISKNDIDLVSLDLYYFKIKATLFKKTYIKPFNIFNLVSIDNKISTGWIKININQE